VRRQTLAALLAAAALGVAAAVVGSCGGIGSDDQVTERLAEPNVLRTKRLDRVPAGTPQETVMRWWRALQFDNAGDASRYYARSLGLTPTKLDRQLQGTVGVLNLGAIPRLVDVDVEGNRATVQVFLERQDRKPNGRLDRVSTARSFNLVRERGEWKLADNLYVERGIRAAKQFTAALKRRIERRKRAREQEAP
jgi:hypothetical protein